MIIDSNIFLENRQHPNTTSLCCVCYAENNAEAYHHIRIYKYIYKHICIAYVSFSKFHNNAKPFSLNTNDIHIYRLMWKMHALLSQIACASVAAAQNRFSIIYDDVPYLTRTRQMCMYMRCACYCNFPFFPSTITLCMDGYERNATRYNRRMYAKDQKMSYIFLSSFSIYKWEHTNESEALKDSYNNNNNNNALTDAHFVYAHYTYFIIWCSNCVTRRCMRVCMYVYYAYSIREIQFGFLCTEKIEFY